VREIGTRDSDDSVALAMKHIFSQLEINELDIT